ncbi:MAG TPA: DUF2062 domain-containing protein [Methylibium sp.]|nr:DUF2062 domain-containing protein [Methylibium sp.]
MRRWLPTREELRAKPWLAPLAHHFENERLWHTDRGSVARAVAIGLFFGFMIPVAQFLFAIALAIALRANIAIAAAATLVTNPFTFPPIYWAAYKVGGALIDAPDDAAALQLERDTEVLVHEATNVEGLWATLQAAGAPLVIGLAVFAVSAAIIGFCAAWLLWRPRADAQDGRGG